MVEGGNEFKYQERKKTHRAARELARLTGESMSAAVDKALRERLERVRKNKGSGLAERLLKILA